LSTRFDAFVIYGFRLPSADDFRARFKVEVDGFVSYHRLRVRPFSEGTGGYSHLGVELTCIEDIARSSNASRELPNLLNDIGFQKIMDVEAAARLLGTKPSFFLIGSIS
jgi:hypothetical protein